MKKLVLASLLTLSFTAQAQHYGHYGHGYRGYGPGWGWAVPAIIGGAVVYSATRPETVIVQPPPVVVQQPTVQYQNCTPWTETQNSDGTVTRTRTCAQ